MYQSYPQGHDEGSVVPGYTDPKICRSFITYSDDDGMTWSKSQEITKSVKRPEYVTSIASGPGVGIQLRRGKYAGRLIIPFNQGSYDEWKVYNTYSDDNGRTWKYGQLADGELGNEIQAVELTDGTVMVNTRSHRDKGNRLISFSKDGGRTLSALQEEPALIEPQCQGSILHFTDPLDGYKSRILFSNPASKTDRTNMTVRLSYDEGKTWPVSKEMYLGSSAYSCLTVLPSNMIGCLYERDNYRKITLARLSLEYLTDGKDHLSKRNR